MSCSSCALPKRLSLLRPGSAACTSVEGRIRSLCEQGLVHSAVDALSRVEGPLSKPTYLSLLNACSRIKSLPLAKLLHTHLAVHRTHFSIFLADFWVMTLAKCGAVEDALQVSATLPHLTIFSWTALISALAESGRGLEALNVHQCMLTQGVEPDKYTLVSLFKACGSIPDLQQGRKIHTDARRRGIVFDVFVCNTLVRMYGKCGAILEAEEVFCGMSHRTIVSWNAMLSAYVELGQGEKALLLYRQMREEGESLNQLTYVLVIQACKSFLEKEAHHCAKEQSTIELSLPIARALHIEAQRQGYTSSILLGNTLVSVYGKYGAISESENVFVTLSERNVVSWTAVISSYMEKSQGDRALQLFACMHKEGVIPNELTYMVALQACAVLTEKGEFSAKEQRSSLVMLLEIAQALHVDSYRLGYASDALVGNTLMSVYGKCGAIIEAEAVFRGLSIRDAVSCNTIFSVYIEQGEVGKAAQFYRQVQKGHVSVDAVTLTCMLQVSGKIGSVEVCSNVHFSIVSTGYDSAPSVLATLIHAYGSCGSSVDAEVVYDEHLEPDKVLRNACIAGYAGEGNHLATLNIIEKSKAAGMIPDKVSCTSVLSACCHTGLIMEGLEYFDSFCVDYGITPDLQHYGILIDLLGRAGKFARIESLLREMQMQADVGIWLCLLGACRTHGNLKLANLAFQNAVGLLPKEAVAYVLMSNIHEYFGEEHPE